MQISERTPGDVDRMLELARLEKDAQQKDRLLVAVHAIRRMETLDIQNALGRSRGFVQRWAYAYRDGGIDALNDKPRGGSVAKITGDNFTRLKARLDAGPTDADKVCTLRGRDLQRIAREELHADVSLSCVYRTLARMNYSCLAPRPRHEKQDLAAQTKFTQESAPFFSAR
jgi:transposase